MGLVGLQENGNREMGLMMKFYYCYTLSTSSPERVFSKGQVEHASLPPRGWNSYDSFCWTISEEEFLQNAELIAQRLKAHGYEYVVVDYLWYRRKVKGAHTDSLGFDVIDEWGRMIPDPVRWPSSKGGKGFKEVAKKVHSMGLKFGIHVMSGISTQAVNANTPILDTIKVLLVNPNGSAYEESGRQWHAKDVGLKERACAWMPNGFMSVNTNLEAGRAFLRSLYHQYADWGVDFVKHDCVFGTDLNLDEIRVVSKVLRGLSRPIIYSLSPGTSATPTIAKDVHGLVNMYRITDDDWDLWGDVAGHFNVARDFSAANMIGAQGLLGKSWPDLDMLPLGWLTDPGSNEGPHRSSNLNLDEQKTQFPYVTGTNGLRYKNRGLNSQSRSLEDMNAPETNIFGLTSCMDPKAKHWSIKSLDNELEQVCWNWNGSTRSKYEAPLCLYTRKPLLESDEEMMYKQQYQGKLHLLATDSMEFCLDASPKRKRTSKEFKRGSFSPCKRDTNQLMLVLEEFALGLLQEEEEHHREGVIVGVHNATPCDISKNIQLVLGEMVELGPTQGELYVAFFNLNSEKTVISAKLSDLAKALPSKHLNNVSCTCKEVWSGKDMGEVKHSISMAIEMHGCALFILHCK
ncbi:hypothetical protein TEA_019541 [Camellia sinensis var. sinensis]|uniref:alpha-galactosidase n=1 Tax=Camellia sinensis var. sinensis TaxID=542762 RepID=A0A4S4DEI3_CAMSN|nr:hypothetical protein TEA_019541 [Camellia sinensis var. sinensis]